MKLKIFPKLLISFLSLSIIPLFILGYNASTNMAETGSAAIAIARQMGEKNLASAKAIGEKAITDSVWQLDEKSTEAVELRTVELARRIADFLYERDRDLLLLAAFPPDPDQYLKAYRTSNRDVIVPGPWPRNGTNASMASVSWQNPENRSSWRHHPPERFETVAKPLYREITFVAPDGRETIKIRDGALSTDLRDISRVENTYCKAEDYFARLPQLEKGQIYVSRVIGAYQKGWLYKGDDGIAVKPESAYAGKENPGGRPFEGIIRWATPVFAGERRVGYLTLALDHTHVMAFTDHVVPTEERFSDISDAGSGNYAFLWDDQDQNISHPRDFFICGYDPETGKEVPGWISQSAYDEYLASGLSLEAFTVGLPAFRNFTQNKKGASQQLAAGTISLDCRILDTAPQCQGWHRGTEDGGSGSFLILWSGLWKLTTYAAVPYHTGIYGASKRGFGYVTIGANVDDFHKAAYVTKAGIEHSIDEQGKDIRNAQERARAVIAESTGRNRTLVMLIALGSALAVTGASIWLSLNVTRPVKHLTLGAQAMSRGDLDQHIPAESGDEIGQLADAFNRMAAAVKEVDHMKSEFVTIASHELRTPIHAMLLGVSGILEGYSGETSEEVRQDLLIVNEGINRLRTLVDTLLDLSRIESRKIELKLQPVSVDRIVNGAVQEITQLLESHGHAIEIRIAPDLPQIEADEKRITQVVVNLLGNAIKYTPDRGKLRVFAERTPEGIAFTVADNGYGIPEWAHQKVFEKFFQADSIMSQKVGGSGLGLTISRGIVEEHGGTIGFVSPIPAGRFNDFPLDDERKGSIFTVRLPIRKGGSCGSE